MTLWTLLQAVLLAVNSLAVLHEERFLARYVGKHEQALGAPERDTSLKAQALGVVNAVSYLRMPLVFINSLVILVKLIFG
mmetsp:Transcript_14145/g.46468  ORF Transcript_14145/g.46468 Transcript_14145/m.46468 type:complete len:80 (+) Transcript_14145:79-318(+)